MSGSPFDVGTLDRMLRIMEAAFEGRAPSGGVAYHVQVHEVSTDQSNPTRVELIDTVAPDPRVVPSLLIGFMYQVLNTEPEGSPPGADNSEKEVDTHGQADHSPPD